MNLSLVVLSEAKTSGKSIPIKLSQFLIGRDPQCHLRPASPVISKRHCALLTKNGRVFLRDFDSTNGTFVNDERVENQRELKNGDVLKIGPVVFRVQLEGSVAVDKPTPLPANRHEESGEEDAAAMLLLPEDGKRIVDESEVTEGDIPGGSTVMEIPAVGMEAEKKAKDKKAEADKAASKDKDTKLQSEHANTATAAAAILAKYSRRQRS